MYTQKSKRCSLKTYCMLITKELSSRRTSVCCFNITINFLSIRMNRQKRSRGNTVYILVFTDVNILLTAEERETLGQTTAQTSKNACRENTVDKRFVCNVIQLKQTQCTVNVSVSTVSATDPLLTAQYTQMFGCVSACFFIYTSSQLNINIYIYLYIYMFFILLTLYFGCWM